MIASIIVFFLLFLLPFVIAPFGVTQFENPKVIFAEIGIIVLFLCLLFSNKISFQNRSKQWVLFSGIFLLSFIDLSFFKTPLSFFGNAFRMQGIFLLWCLLIFSLSSSFKKCAFFSYPQFACHTSKNSHFLNKVLEAHQWLIFCMLLYLELFVTFLLPLNASQRYVGTLGEPNALAAFAIFLWPFGWFAIQNKKANTVSKILLLIPVIILLFLSGSRSGMIAFGIELLFLFLQKSRFTLKKTVVICLFFYLISYIFPFLEHTPYENRVEVWQSALYAGIINPGLGQGFGNTEIALHNAAAGLGLPVQYYYVDSSHNIFLDWWVQGGVIGVSLLLILVYGSMDSFIKKQKKQELVLLFGIVTVLSFNPASIVGLLSFWWLIGRSSAS